MFLIEINKINISSLCSRYYAEACKEWRGPSPRQAPGQNSFNISIATVARLGDTVSDSTDLGIKPLALHADSDILNHYANRPNNCMQAKNNRSNKEESRGA